jgi:outer membrane protein
MATCDRLVIQNNLNAISGQYERTMSLLKFIPVLLCFVVFNVNAAGKSAFINPSILIERAPQALAASKALEKEFSQRDNDLRAAATNIQTLEKSYQNDSAIMSAGQKKKMEDEIVQKKRKFQFDQQSINQDLQKRRQQVLQELQKTISVVIGKYGEENGYDFIFTEGVAYASEEVDITDEILKVLAQ